MGILCWQQYMIRRLGSQCLLESTLNITALDICYELLDQGGTVRRGARSVNEWMLA